MTKPLNLMEISQCSYGRWFSTVMKEKGVETMQDLTASGNLLPKHRTTLANILRGITRVKISPSVRDLICRLTGDEDGEWEAYEKQFGSHLEGDHAPMERVLEKACCGKIYPRFLTGALEKIGILTLDELLEKQHEINARYLYAIIRGKKITCGDRLRTRIAVLVGDAQGEKDAFNRAVQAGEMFVHSGNAQRYIPHTEPIGRLDYEKPKGPEWWHEKQESLALGRGNEAHERCPRCGREFDGVWGWCAACGMPYRKEQGHD